MKVKAQVVSVEFVLNTLVIFLLITYTYLWGADIFQDTIDRARINKGEKISLELAEKLERLLKFGGEEKFTFKIDGIFEIKRNISSGEEYLQMRIPIKKYKNSTWVYVNAKPFYEKSLPFLIRKKYSGNIVYIQIIPGLIEVPNKKIKILLEHASSKRACSGECKILLRKIKTEKNISGGKEIFFVKIGVEVE